MKSPAIGRTTSPALTGTLGDCIAEFFGTMVLILFGNGVSASFTLFNTLGPGGTTTQPIPFASNWVLISLGWGFAVMLGIYVAGAVSGAHLNPAVTLGFASRGKFPWPKVLPYMGSQLLGAFIAAAIVYFVYRGAINNAIVIATTKGMPNTVSSVAGGVFYTSPKPFVGLFGAFGDEFVGTALLVGLIFAITDGRNQPVQGNLNPLIIGLVIVAISASFGLNTGYAINPARDFGPRLWVAVVDAGRSLNSYTWIPIVAPLLGGVVGAYIYDFTVGRVLVARQIATSGDTITTGRAVREPHRDSSFD